MKASAGVKVSVDQDWVERLLERGDTMYRVSQITKYPNTVINDIAVGKFRPHYIKRPTRNQHKEPEKGMCTCCGTRPKKHGNHFLCAICEKHGGDGEIYPETYSC